MIGRAGSRSSKARSCTICAQDRADQRSRHSGRGGGAGRPEIGGTAPAVRTAPLIAYAGAAGAVALGRGSVIDRYIGLQSISRVFLMAVLTSAIAWGLRPALFACPLSVLLNFFFIPLICTFTISDPENAVALFFFALVAVVVSNLTAAKPRVKRQDKGGEGATEIAYYTVARGRNPLLRSSSASLTASSVTRAANGPSRHASIIAATASSRPMTSASTVPSERLRTQPRSPSREAVSSAQAR